MKVALVCPYDLEAPGGVQQVVWELAERLERTMSAVTVIGPGPLLRPGYVGVGRSRRLPANRSTVPLSLDPRVGARVRKAVDDCDVVHVHEPFIPLTGWAGTRTGLPTVLTFHADPPRWARSLYQRVSGLGARLVGRAAGLTAVSPVAASALPPSWGPVETISNGLDHASYSPGVARHGQRVTFLGRDDRRKGLDVLLQAWPEVRRWQPRAELVVLGAERTGDVPGVDFRGRVSEVVKREVLAGSSVFVAPNLGGESFGMVVAEAMAAGCAVVASDLAAFRAVAGEAARFFPAGDAGALAAGIVGLLSDPESARRLGQEAREAARRFDWTFVAAAYGGVYESALARHRSNL